LQNSAAGERSTAHLPRVEGNTRNPCSKGKWTHRWEKKGCTAELQNEEGKRRGADSTEPAASGGRGKKTPQKKKPSCRCRINNDMLYRRRILSGILQNSSPRGGEGKKNARGEQGRAGKRKKRERRDERSDSVNRRNGQEKGKRRKPMQSSATKVLLCNREIFCNGRKTAEVFCEGAHVRKRRKSEKDTPRRRRARRGLDLPPRRRRETRGVTFSCPDK